MLYITQKVPYSSPKPAKRIIAVDIPTQQGHSEQGVTVKTAAAAMKVFMAVLFLALARESKFLLYHYKR